MTKIIRLDERLADLSAPVLDLVPGVPGYTDRYTAATIPSAPGTPVTTWNPVAAGGTLTKTSGGTGPFTIVDDAGLRYLRAPGGGGSGRLLGPNKGSLPFTIAGVVRAAGTYVVGVMGANGAAITKSSHGIWTGTGGGTVTSASTSNEWAFVLLQVAADKTMTVRVDGGEASATTTLTPPSSFNGFYVGPSTATVADYLEATYWPFAFTPAQRDAAHAYAREMHPMLP